MSSREIAQETIYILTEDMSAEELRRIADSLPVDVALAAEHFALEYIPGVAMQFVEELTKSDVSLPYELYAIASGRERAENETTNEVKTSENN